MRPFVPHSVSPFRRQLGASAWLLALGVLLTALSAHPVCAQTSVNSSTQVVPNGPGANGGSATQMWGTSSGASGASPSGSLLDSANAHESLGNSAALVNSAKRGFLYSQGTSIVFESIGAQSIVNTSIYGDNNVADVSANQTATNNGAVNAVGSITLSGNANTNNTTTGASSTAAATKSSNAAARSTATRPQLPSSSGNAPNTSAAGESTAANPPSPGQS